MKTALTFLMGTLLCIFVSSDAHGQLTLPGMRPIEAPRVQLRSAGLRPIDAPRAKPKNVIDLGDWTPRLPDRGPIEVPDLFGGRPRNPNGPNFNLGPNGPSVGWGNGPQVNIHLPGRLGRRLNPASPRVYVPQTHVHNAAYPPPVYHRPAAQHVVQVPVYDAYGNVVGYRTQTQWHQ